MPRQHNLTEPCDLKAWTPRRTSPRHARARDFGKANRAFYTVSPLTAICKTGIRPHRIESAFMASGSPLIPYPHGGPSFRAVCPTAPSPDSRPSARHALDRLTRPLDRSTLPALRSVRCPSRPSRPSAPFPLDHGQGTGQPAQPCTRPSRGDDSCRWVTIAGDDCGQTGDDCTGGKGDDSGVTIRGRVIDG